MMTCYIRFPLSKWEWNSPAGLEDISFCVVTALPQVMRGPGKEPQRPLGTDNGLLTPRKWAPQSCYCKKPTAAQQPHAFGSESQAQESHASCWCSEPSLVSHWAENPVKLCLTPDPTQTGLMKSHWVRASQVALVVKKPPCNAGDSPAERNGSLSSITAWRIPWTEEPGGSQSTGSQRVRRDWATEHARTS